MQKKFNNEEELAAYFQNYLESKGFDCYPEVVFDIFSGRPDIVAVKNNKIYVFECKMNFGLNVVTQTFRWFNRYKPSYGFPDYIYAVTPYKKSASRRNELLDSVMKQNGIGHIMVGDPRVGRAKMFDGSTHFYEKDIHSVLDAKPQRKGQEYGKVLIEQLYDDMKDANAGTTGTEIMTPFKRTMNRVKEIMQDGVARTPKDMLPLIEKIGGHHYSSNSSFYSQVRKLYHLADLKVVQKDGKIHYERRT
ncbi:MAG: hypothetical protein CL489_08945 [Acidobacteria bacterium]|nr:hypothetical protein [Acidobacteriota bacterium]|tara:strand:- start:37410 stop:38153 length:744 start_codon:yes stop_codon:yes gene_type:complete